MPHKSFPSDAVHKICRSAGRDKKLAVGRLHEVEMSLKIVPGRREKNLRHGKANTKLIWVLDIPCILSSAPPL